MRKVTTAFAIALLLTLFVAPVVRAQTIEISLSETEYEIRRGSERYRTFDLRVDPIGGYSKSVTVSAENVPSGANVSFDGYPTKSGVPPLTSEVTISVPREVELGEYYMVFKAVGEGATDSTTYRLKVKEEYVPPKEEKKIEVPVYVWVGVGVAVALLLAVVFYLRIRARREWAPTPPAPAPPAG